jgi:CBS domain-containing protein
MRNDAPVVDANRHFKDVIHQLLKSRNNQIYVVEQDGALIGAIDIHDLKEFFNEQDLYSLVLARDIAEPVDVAYPEQSVIDIMDSLYATEDEQMPVVKDSATKKFLGVITGRDIIGAYSREVLKKKMLIAKFVTRGKEREGIDYVEMPAGYRLGKIPVPSEFEGKTLGQLNFRSNYRLHVLEVVRPWQDGKAQRYLAASEFKLKQGDSLIVIGSDDDFRAYDAITSLEKDNHSAQTS